MRALIAIAVAVAAPAHAEDWAIKRQPGENARFAWDRLYGGIRTPEAWWHAFEAQAVARDDGALGEYLVQLASTHAIAIAQSAQPAWLARAVTMPACRLVGRLAALAAADQLALEIDWNLRGRDGATPLISAIASRNDRCVHALLGVKAVAIDLADAAGIPPLGHVLLTRNAALVPAVLARAPKRDFLLQGVALDEWALRHDSWLAIQLVTGASGRALVGYTFPTGPLAGRSLLQVAAMRDCSAIARELLALGADPAARPVVPTPRGEADLSFLGDATSPGPPVELAVVNGAWNTLALFLTHSPSLVGSAVLGTPLVQYVISSSEPAGIETVLRAGVGLVGQGSPLAWLAAGWPDYSSRSLLAARAPELTPEEGATREDLRATTRYREWVTWTTCDRMVAAGVHGLDPDSDIARLVELRAVYAEIERDGFTRVAKRRGATHLIALAWTTPEGFPVTLFDVAFQRDDVKTARALVAAGYLPKSWSKETIDLVRGARAEWAALVD